MRQRDIRHLLAVLSFGMACQVGQIGLWKGTWKGTRGGDVPD